LSSANRRCRKGQSNPERAFASLRASRWRKEEFPYHLFAALKRRSSTKKLLQARMCAPPGFIRQSGACGGIFEALFA